MVGVKEGFYLEKVHLALLSQSKNHINIEIILDESPDIEIENSKLK